MAYKEATDRELYTKLIQFYPVVEPGHQFVSNIINEFAKHDIGSSYSLSSLESWQRRFQDWLPEKVGLLRNPDDADNWNRFIVVDQGLYSFALLRYS